MISITEGNNLAVVLKVNREMKNTENNFYLVGYKAKDAFNIFYVISEDLLMQAAKARQNI
ncbi:hypothetical protein [Wolbachia endosymbiont (group A) of Agelastica alni]|uniref:hypothetical protein n=1 Tax=Wolbachia endosymbiont (group A) of Agelastica alni TaxID=3066130 RepID=UPI003132D0BE